MNSDPCCGVPVQCLRPDDECKHREAHHADRGLYHPLADAVLEARIEGAARALGASGDFKPATPEQVQAWLNTPIRDMLARGEVASPGPVGVGMGALATQVGGDHYKDLKIQPVEYIHANNIPFIEGSVIKYVTRWRAKNGIKDLEKARHFIDLLIELENAARS